MENIWENDEFVTVLDDTLTKRRHTTKIGEIDPWRDVVVDNLLDINNGDIFLDIGCGSGERINRIQKDCFTIGIDVSKKLCKEAKIRSANGEIILASVEYLPFKEGTFTKIVSVYSLVYVEEKLKAFQEISRVLKPGGILVIYDPNKLSFRTLLRRLQLLKFSCMRQKDNPRFTHHKIVTSQAMTIFQYQNICTALHLTLERWGGNFFSLYYKLPSILQINTQNIQSGNIGDTPVFRYFSDFLILKIKKEKF
jgi:ubiquinone/menaquinone biosynthesis C-methylase UbiE